MRRLAALMIGLADFLLTGVAVLAGLAVWLLVTGPIATDYLTPYLERQLSGGALRVEIGRSLVRWDGLGRPIRLVAERVEVADAGRPAALLPEVALALDPRALLDGRLAPVTLSLQGPALHVVRTADGEVRWALEAGPAAGRPPLADAARPPAAPAAPAGPADPDGWPDSLSRLERVEVAGAAIVFEDRREGRVWRGRDVSLAFERSEAGLQARFSGEVALGEQSGRVAAAAIRHAGDGHTDIALRVAGLPSQLLAQADETLAPLSAVRTRLDGSARLRLAPGWQPVRATFDLSGGTGRLALSGLYEEPLTVARMALAVEADFAAETLSVRRAELDLGGPRILAAGDMRVQHGGFRSALTATLFDLPADLLPRYWPPSLDSEARAWTAGHISGGFVDHATLEIEARSPLDRPAAFEPQSLRARFAYSGLTVRYLDGLPPVEGVGGSGSFDGEAVRFAIRGGRLRGLRLEDSAIAITGLEETGRAAIDIDLALAGPLSAALEVLDAPRLGYAAALGLDPAGVSGGMATRLRFAFPLSADLALEEVAVGAAANLRGVSLGDIASGLPTRVDEARLSLTGSGLQAAGRGSVAGVPADFVWRERFAAGAGPATEIALSGRLGDDDLARLGLGGGPLAGPVPFEATFRNGDGQAQALDARFDLTDAAIAIPDLAYDKPPGAAAEATLALALEGGELRGPVSFTLSGGALEAAGSAIVGEDRETLQTLGLDRFRLGETRFAGTVRRTEAGGFAVEIAGPRFDARRWLTPDALTAHALPGDAPPAAGPALQGPEEPGAPEGGPATPWQVAARFDEVVVAEDAALHDATVDFARAGDGAESGVLVAQTGDGGAIRLEYSSDGAGAATATLHADDADAVLRAFGLGGRMRGGALFLRAALTGDRAAGQIRVDDFHAVEAPLLARLLGAMSLDGLVALLGGDGLFFDRLSADLALSGDTLAISDGRAAGSSLGLYAEGTVGLDGGGLDLSGTVVPAYAFNRTIGAIPLFGTLLTGGEGGGIIAFTYRATGPLDDPQVQVNPLSALAPGLLRRIFFVRDPDAPRGEDVSAGEPDQR